MRDAKMTFNATSRGQCWNVFCALPCLLMTSNNTFAWELKFLEFDLRIIYCGIIIWASTPMLLLTHTSVSMSISLAVSSVTSYSFYIFPMRSLVTRTSSAVLTINVSILTVSYASIDRLFLKVLIIHHTKTTATTNVGRLQLWARNRQSRK
jgi:hypothetical protein